MTQRWTPGTTGDSTQLFPYAWPYLPFHRNIEVEVKALRYTGDKVVDSNTVIDYFPRVI